MVWGRFRGSPRPTPAPAGAPASTCSASGAPPTTAVRRPSPRTVGCPPAARRCARPPPPPLHHGGQALGFGRGEVVALGGVGPPGRRAPTGRSLKARLLWPGSGGRSPPSSPPGTAPGTRTSRGAGRCGAPSASRRRPTSRRAGPFSGRWLDRRVDPVRPAARCPRAPTPFPVLEMFGCRALDQEKSKRVITARIPGRGASPRGRPRGSSTT